MDDQNPVLFFIGQPGVEVKHGYFVRAGLTEKEHYSMKRDPSFREKSLAALTIVIWHDFHLLAGRRTTEFRSSLGQQIAESFWLFETHFEITQEHSLTGT